jgi:hypothetical protein
LSPANDSTSEQFPEESKNEGRKAHLRSVLLIRVVLFCDDPVEDPLDNGRSLDEGFRQGRVKGKEVLEDAWRTSGSMSGALGRATDSFEEGGG